jgi:hypothetical protein
MFRKSLTAIVLSTIAAGAVLAADGAHRGPHGKGPAPEEFLKAHIARVDTNRDGQVSREEAKAGAPRWEILFDAVDANKDGQLSQDEIKGFHQRMRQAHQAERQQRSAAMMKKLDANGDGSLSKPEVAQAGPLAKRFDRIDANHDGQLSAEELQAARPHGRRHHHGPRG